MKDRIPTYPGRVRLASVEGQDGVYDMVRMDEPTEAGTPLNKANLLSDTTAAALELSGSDPTVNDALAAIAASMANRYSQINTKFGELETLIANCGNCRIAIGSYVGTGTSGSANPCKISLGFRPYVIMLDVATKYFISNTASPIYYIMQYPRTTLMGTGANNEENVITWGDDGVTWYSPSTSSDAEIRAIRQFNYSGKTYHYIAFGV